MDIQVDVRGLDEIERKLRLLPDRLGNNAMRRALRKGANIVRDAARKNAQKIDDLKTREQIYKNIAVYGGGRRREKEVGGVMMRVGVRGGARPTRGDIAAPGGNTTHWRFIEFGTSEASAKPFMRPAMNSTASQVFNAVAESATKELDKELDKLK